jgi:hypothetical protein
MEFSILMPEAKAIRLRPLGFEFIGVLYPSPGTGEA